VPTHDIDRVLARALRIEQELAQREVDRLEQVLARLEQQAPTGQPLPTDQ